MLIHVFEAVYYENNWKKVIKVEISRLHIIKEKQIQRKKVKIH